MPASAPVADVGAVDEPMIGAVRLRVVSDAAASGAGALRAKLKR